MKKESNDLELKIKKLIKLWKKTHKKRLIEPKSEEWCITQIIYDLKELLKN